MLLDKPVGITVKTLINQQLYFLQTVLSQKQQQDMDFIVRLIRYPDEHPELFNNPAVRHYAGYFEGMADALDMSLDELFEEIQHDR
jgi:hypothetical protein